MPLANDRSFIPCRLQDRWERRLRPVENVAIVEYTVDVAVLSGKNDGAVGSANAVGTECVGESNAQLGDAVEVGLRIDLAAIATHRVRSVIVGHDEDEVGTNRRLVGNSRTGRQGRNCKEQCSKSDSQHNGCSSREFSIPRMIEQPLNRKTVNGAIDGNECKS